ncbi:zinc D-Ala-D-Ala carboxypeptidase-like [Paramacrobiotus metropolitanus]|uniref:zinc D-Ala-D-Ala carboxypeptidase-like n=1 Tax=Paramacrobiotus metropolitanus TaxID=2943436 RepID=UPI002445F94C|nr:zinc D-Ala-D-Ala carboxypeptidase-like [Paramacrobiotus metropolitanus]
MFQNIKLLFFIAGLLPAAVLSAQCSQKLQVGSKGDCVKEVQRKVGTSADGIFGQSTQAAVKAFQRRHGLEADGIVGANTWAVIYGSSGSGTGSAPGGCGCDANRATQCTSGATPGAKNLASYLKNKFGGRTEIFNCRNVRGGSTVSLHGEGRAVDFYPSNLSNGQAVVNHLKSIACQNGIQEVIFNRQIWTKGGTLTYKGLNPHTDHIHVGLNKCGAQSFNL